MCPPAREAEAGAEGAIRRESRAFTRGPAPERLLAASCGGRLDKVHREVEYLARSHTACSCGAGCKPRVRSGRPGGGGGGSGWAPAGEPPGLGGAAAGGEGRSPAANERPGGEAFLSSRHPSLSRKPARPEPAAHPKSPPARAQQECGSWPASLCPLPCKYTHTQLAGAVGGERRGEGLRTRIRTPQGEVGVQLPAQRLRSLPGALWANDRERRPRCRTHSRGGGGCSSGRAAGR